jgi:alpha-glucosidase
MLPDSARQDPVFFRTKGVDKGRDGARVPIPWESNQLNFGFSTGQPWLPMPEHWNELCVASQLNMSAEESSTYEGLSHLDLYRHSLKLRKFFKGNSFDWIAKSNTLLSFKRGENYLVIANVSDEEIEFVIPSEFKNSKIILCSSNGARISDLKATIPANSSIWIAR